MYNTAQLHNRNVRVKRLFGLLRKFRKNTQVNNDQTSGYDASLVSF